MKITNETKLGFIVIISFLILFLIIIFLGKLEFKKQGYIIKVRFSFIGDLKVGAPVIFAGGIRIGKVIKIVPYQDIVEVVLKINKDFKIKKSSEIAIYTQGLLGEKYIEIHGFEGADEYLKNGDTVRGIDPVSLDAISIKLAKLVKGVFEPTLTDENVKKSFANLFNNAGAFAYNLNMLIKENRKNIYYSIYNIQTMAQILNKNLASILKEINKLSKDIGSISKENQESIKETIKNLEKTSKQLSIAVKELNKSSKNLSSITTAIKKRKGTIGKLIYEKDIYNSLYRTSKNLEKFSEKIKKQPRILILGK